MTVFDKSIFYLFSDVLSVIPHSLSRNCFTLIKSNFLLISKGVITYITLTGTIISNNIIKKYHGIIKTFKVLVIVKRKQFSRINILIQNRSITLNKQLFFEIKNILMMPYAKMVNSSKNEILLQIRGMVTNCTLF